MKRESKTVTQSCPCPHMVDIFHQKVQEALEDGWIPSGQVMVIDDYAAGQGHAFQARKGAQTYTQHFYR
ncbi:MAG: hypothetical protein ACKUBY_04835 [Candidatus Moraniibacteriota bacterium]|jgi:hypothetical protein